MDLCEAMMSAAFQKWGQASQHAMGVSLLAFCFSYAHLARIKQA